MSKVGFEEGIQGLIDYVERLVGENTKLFVGVNQLVHSHDAIHEKLDAIYEEIQEIKKVIKGGNQRR